MTELPNLPGNQFADAIGLLQTLKVRAARENKRKNLELLWNVLEGMWRDGCRSYGLAEVGRRLTEAGGPKTQSLRNEGGEDFRRIIEAFGICARGHSSVQQGPGRSQLELAVDCLHDPALRAMFRQVVAENKLYKTQNDQLRSSFKELSITRQVDTLSTVNAPQFEVSTPTAPLTTREKDLLRRNLSPERFEENGWKITEEGSVMDDTGIVVLSPGFLTIMGKLLSSSP